MSIPKISTKELEHILAHTSVDDMPLFFKEQKEEMYHCPKPFANYMKQVIKNKKLRLRDIFISADIGERYGYKIIEEHEHTRQRDLILRICYAARFTLEETQRALSLYGFSELQSSDFRDATLISVFLKRPGTILEVNMKLKEKELPILKFYDET